MSGSRTSPRRKCCTTANPARPADPAWYLGEAVSEQLDHGRHHALDAARLRRLEQLSRIAGVTQWAVAG
jgi:hypothetical protein